MTTRMRNVVWMALGCMAVVPAIHAQTWPARPITMVVPGAPGASTDILGRFVARIIEQRLKQPVIVENRVGAGGYVGAEAVTRAEPDGYTLLFTNETTLHSSIFVREHKVLWRELTVIAGVATLPMVMISPANLKATTLREFIATARAAPGKYNFGYPSNSTMQLELIGFLNAYGLNLAGIPYQGGAQQAIASGEVQLTLLSAPISKPLIDGGKAVGIAATSGTRTSVLPTLATAREQGYDMDFNLWTGLFAPVRLPKPIQERLAREINEGVAQPEARDMLAKVGAGAMTATAEQLNKGIADTGRRYAEIARMARITPE